MQVDRRHLIVSGLATALMGQRASAEQGLSRQLVNGHLPPFAIEGQGERRAG
ncbi:MAG: hypothetical protein ACK4F7_02810 [Inhella sp.]